MLLVLLVLLVLVLLLLLCSEEGCGALLQLAMVDEWLWIGVLLV